MNQIYKNSEFIIIPHYKGKRKEFIVINTKKKRKKGFKKSHTHLNSFKMSVYLIKLVKSGRINNGLSPYLLRSMIRISDNDNYSQKIEDLIEVKRNKKSAYVNIPKKKK